MEHSAAVESPDGSPEQPDDFKVRSAVDIQRQIRIFSAQKPACVLSISPPRLARAICVAGDVVRPVDIDDGPWETTMVPSDPQLTSRSPFLLIPKLCLTDGSLLSQ